METKGTSVRLVEVLREFGPSGLPFKLLARKLQRREQDVERDFDRLRGDGVVERIGEIVRLRPANEIPERLAS